MLIIVHLIAISLFLSRVQITNIVITSLQFGRQYLVYPLLDSSCSESVSENASQDDTDSALLARKERSISAIFSALYCVFGFFLFLFFAASSSV